MLSPARSLYSFRMVTIALVAWVVFLVMAAERSRRSRRLEAAIAASEPQRPAPAALATVTQFHPGGRRVVRFQRENSKWPTLVGC